MYICIYIYYQALLPHIKIPKARLDKSNAHWLRGESFNKFTDHMAIFFAFFRSDHSSACSSSSSVLVAIEKQFRDKGHETSWETIREALRTQQVVTVVLPTVDGKTLRLRRATKAEDAHQDIYNILGIPTDVIAPVKTWVDA